MTGKIFRSTLLVVLAVLCISGGLFSGLLYRYYEEQSFELLSQEARKLSQSMEYTDLSNLRTADRVTLIGQDGTVLYDSAAETGQMDNHLSRQEVAQALANGSGQSSHYSTTMLQKNLYYALRLSNGQVLRLSRVQSSLGAMLLGMLWPIVLTAAVLLGAAALLSLRLARQITSPINAISLDDPQDCYPELAPLTGRLRQQNVTIRQQMDELSRRMREFSAITENMSEGMLLVDGHGCVLSENHSAAQLMPQALRQKTGALSEAVQEALAGRRCERLITQGDRSLSVMANPVTAEGQVAGAVALILDVTEREQREQLRREFSANVSHELKTPLTSISGFAELMQQGLVPPEKMKEFSGDILRESNRLIGLVEDIINLSRLDEGGGGMDWEQVDLYALCRDVISRLAPAAEKKGVTVTLSGEVQMLRGVWQVLQEMVYNLCDNAIKYNREGGRVTVTVSCRDGRPVLTVADTGIGIPYEHQSRVFERFYRVDKSHSRAIGGTGLGLSIVKHGAALHDAVIDLESTPGLGTTITVRF